MARRIVNRMEKRAELEAFERRKEGDEPEDEEEEGDEDEEEGDDEEEGEAGDEDESEDEGEGDEDDEDAPKKKKKPAAKPKPKPKPKAKPRSRAVKTTRMRVVWGVFNNSHQMVASYEYPRRQEADAHAARLTAEKRNTHFVQPVKEPIVEDKDKDKK